MLLRKLLRNAYQLLWLSRDLLVHQLPQCEKLPTSWRRKDITVILNAARVMTLSLSVLNARQ